MEGSGCSGRRVETAQNPSLPRGREGLGVQGLGFRTLTQGQKDKPRLPQIPNQGLGFRVSGLGLRV